MKTLNLNEKHKTTYCIPLWQRDEQMKINISKVKERIDAGDIKKEDVAIVCFGNSLKDTYKEIEKFKIIISCSGAHKFLIEKGIIPTYHIEVDPREHKIKLLGEPHKDVKYLIASCIHPKYLDHLNGYNVKLWHVFANGENGETFPEIFPRGEWAITGGSSVGLRAMTIARFLGYTEQHIFGMDGNFNGEKESHAMEHPNSPKQVFETKLNDKIFYTTPAFLECAKQTFHELNMMKDVNAKFYGEGLVQEMAKSYVRTPIENVMIAFNTPELISSEYVNLNKQLHQDNLAYGIGGGKHKNVVLKLSKELNTTSILDYGCGKGYLAKQLPFPIWEYDPAIDGKNKTPKPADLVICTDVLEHIEPEKLNFVLDDLRRVTKKIGYFTIHMKASGKTLADGRNTHLIQRDEKWWTKKLSKFFTLIPKSIINKNPILHVVVSPKTK